MLALYNLSSNVALIKSIFSLVNSISNSQKWLAEKCILRVKEVNLEKNKKPRNGETRSPHVSL